MDHYMCFIVVNIDIEQSLSRGAGQHIMSSMGNLKRDANHHYDSSLRSQLLPAFLLQDEIAIRGDRRIYSKKGKSNK
ncbi:hypothetical protein M514_02992 [Trichuris suis]|uniref:Uncharacterized protein n=1 Tax=Trichuris suis TaxID=68888 RepID=A0A085NI31_9BILA|nr:hypothetical protein M514_02992 [Trichuris suis]